MKRGEIYHADFRPRSGSERRGKRPCIVVSNDGFNIVPTCRSVIVVPFSTSASQTARGPSAAPFAAGEGGNPRDSVALCHQLTTLDRSKLGERLGELNEAALLRLEAGLMAALGLP